MTEEEMQAKLAEMAETNRVETERLNKLLVEKSRRDMLKKMSFASVLKTLGERQVEVIITSPKIDRDGDIVEVGGIDLKSFLQNPVILFQHNSNMPVARCVNLKRVGETLVATAQFPQVGISEKADEVYGLIKSEIINAASIGFIPKESESRDAQNPWHGQHYKKVEMLEFSFVSIPANTDARIVSRQFVGEVGKFCSWTSEHGFEFGKVKSFSPATAGTAAEVVVEVWQKDVEDWSSTQAELTFKIEGAHTDFISVGDLKEKAKEPSNSPCNPTPEEIKSKEARLRAVSALRLRADGFAEETA